MPAAIFLVASIYFPSLKNLKGLPLLLVPKKVPPCLIKNP